MFLVRRCTVGTRPHNNSSRRATCARATLSRTHGTVERILRYPDGVERRICYPAPVDVEGPGAPEEPPEFTETQLGLGFWDFQQPTTEPEPQLQPSTSAPGDGSQELFSFDWAAMRRQAEEAQRRAAASATVHAHGCPWVLPRPLFVLTLSNDASHRFYTLRTRVQKEQEVTDELARVLGNASLAASISMSDMEDGVVAFHSRQEAQRFALSLQDEREGRDEVSVMEMGSHELFRFAGEASGVVVTVEGQGPEAWLPEPHQLAGVLRGQSAWEDAL